VNLDDSLRAALRREAAPADFAAKVLAKAALEDKVAAFPAWRRRATVAAWPRAATWAIAAGLAVAALLPPAALEYRHRREVRALEAKKELLFALQITRAKLRQTRERVHRATTRHTL
jgi:hypothetical protein